MASLRIATRASELARWQAKHVASIVGCDTELVVLSTRGDRDLTSPLEEIGGQGVFVKEIQAAVLEGRADIAVHSAKDLPTASVEGLEIGAFPKRGDPRDALVGRPLMELSSGDVIATGSARRKAQLKALRSDLEFAPIRGNISTRLSKVSDFGAVAMAYAALERLGLEGEAAQVFDPFEVVPQIGQGALAVEFRKGDSRVELLLKAIDHQPTRLAVEAERALLGRLGSGCALPVGAHAIFRQSENLIEMVGFIGLTDGSFGVRVSGKGKDPKELGARLGDALLSRGGKRILESLDTGDANGQP